MSPRRTPGGPTPISDVLRIRPPPPAVVNADEDTLRQAKNPRTPATASAASSRTAVQAAQHPWYEPNRRTRRSQRNPSPRADQRDGLLDAPLPDVEPDDELDDEEPELDLLDCDDDSLLDDFFESLELLDDFFESLELLDDFFESLELLDEFFDEFEVLPPLPLIAFCSHFCNSARLMPFAVPPSVFVVPPLDEPPSLDDELLELLETLVLDRVTFGAPEVGCPSANAVALTVAAAAIVNRLSRMWFSSPASRAANEEFLVKMRSNHLLRQTPGRSMGGRLVFVSNR